MPANKVERIEPCLSIEEDIEYQEKGWIIQHTATWIIFGLVILIASGLFGNGPLSSVTAQQGPVTLKYERFLHQLGSTQTDIFLTPVDSFTTISLPLSYLDHFTVESITPEPLENFISGSTLVYRFSTRQAGRFTFQLTALVTGLYKDTIRVNGNPVLFSHFTYP